MKPRGAVLMVQGTSSSAGKSFLVAGICRLLVDEGRSAAPFKSQNMSNNAFVTSDGCEIGRAQAVQARAARLVPHVDMNPVLLKPEADHRSQVIVMGRPYATLHAAAYQEAKETIWGEVTAALDRLREQYDVVVIEGAGSPAEINLKARDISNMRVALHAQAPVLIVGDIDRGGVFAHLYGTQKLLEPSEQRLVKGFIINRFRGDPSLLEPGLQDIERLTGVPVVGVVPWVHNHGLPEEDSVALDHRPHATGAFAGVDVAVVRFPRIANFDDFDPLVREPGVRLRYVDDATKLGDPDVIVLPGTKSTIADLRWLRERSFHVAVAASVRRGAALVGICGGFQMLGDAIDDPFGVESDEGHVEGLGLLAVTTRFEKEKQTRQTAATLAGLDGLLAGTAGNRLEGYEIHAGQTGIAGPGALRADDGRALATIDAGGWIFGCYLHGLFHSRPFRQAVLANVARRRHKVYDPSPADEVDPFDRVADVLRSSLDLPTLHRLIDDQPP